MGQASNNNDNNNTNNNNNNGNDNDNVDQLASNQNTTSENSSTATGKMPAGRSFSYPFRIDQINHQNNENHELA